MNKFSFVQVLTYCDCIDVTQVYNKEDFNTLVNNVGLTEQQAFDNLKERKLAATFLDIYTHIKG